MKYSKRNIYCSDDFRRNILEFDDHFYQISPLSSDSDKSKGGNSCVFKLFDSNNDKNLIIKFCKYPLKKKNPEWVKQRIDRFYREVEALQKAKDYSCENIIDMKFHGMHIISQRRFLYYVMEFGESDLTRYMSSEEIPFDQKIVLCAEILKGLEDLHKIEVYHRDLKPDNIFYANQTWKIGDLGLISYRQEDQNLDIINEKIGPYGWLSPEAMNKVICEGTLLENKHHCLIGQYSDIFQLGKVFWYIFEGNIPIGHTLEEDFKSGVSNVYKILVKMLQYSHSNRPPLDQLISQFEEASDSYLTA